MAILIDENTRLLVQGITGREGTRSTKQMLEYGTKIVAGVTPGKGGQEVEGIPVYNSVKEAMKKHPEINATVLYVPPAGVKDAAKEAIDNGIPLINIITEHVPIKDSAFLYQYAKKKSSFLEKSCTKKIRIIGPSSIGIISPGKCKVGSIGGMDPTIQFVPGPVGVISKSGGMSSEISLIIKRAGLGQSTVIGIGGDVIVGTTFHDLLDLFEKDPETKGVVIFGELGGTYEEQLSEYVKSGKFTKPIAAFIGGEFAANLPEGQALGHAGALIEGKTGLPSVKKKLLEEAGVKVAKVPGELGELIKRAISKPLEKV